MQVAAATNSTDYPFDIKPIKVLINIVSIFPIGSLVKLNNHEVGRVIRNSRLRPSRPMVYIVNPAIKEDFWKE